MLQSWLQMIFGPNGEPIVQKMQEWALSKLDKAFRPSAAGFLDMLQVPWDLYGNEDKQGKAKAIWQSSQGHKHVLEGFFHDDKLVGNVHIKQYGKWSVWPEMLCSFLKHPRSCGVT